MFLVRHAFQGDQCLGGLQLVVERNEFVLSAERPAGFVLSRNDELEGFEEFIAT